ncbi:MAG TPA: ferritin-like domain-containing protein, partial [Solirubrobacteraceae bacterium]|nr:ferritin-like domain-containing protein [Solirubrobacteraceae bacterium]
LELSGRDYAIALLRLAGEIEHGLMVQYLFAAYSLDPPRAPAAQRPMVRRWQEAILGIAKEEMAHLVTVQNLLTALGGPLQFNREDFPHDTVLYPSGFRLRPLSLPSLATYVVAESPEDWEGEQAERIKGQASGEAGGAVNRVGRLFEELIAVVGDPALVPDGTFEAASMPFQASWDEWGRGYRRGERGRQVLGDPNAPAVPELVIVAVDSRRTAIAALEQVGEQGEGFGMPRDEDESHFERFLKVHEELEALSEDERRALVREVATNPTTDLSGPDVGAAPADTETTSPIANPAARLWAHLFNVRYRKLLVSLAHAFELAEDRTQPVTPGPRGSLIHRAFAEMYNLRAIAGLLVALPLDHVRPDGARAGPPFQMPHTLMLPHDEDDRWRLHRDLLDASATLADRIRGVDGAGTAQDYLTALAQADRIERDQVDALIAATARTPAGAPTP